MHSDGERLAVVEVKVDELTIKVDKLTEKVDRLTDLVAQGKGASRLLRYLILFFGASTVAGVAARWHDFLRWFGS